MSETRDTATSRLAIRRLNLSCFRNYSRLSLQLEAAPVILTGHNGAGKTNLLEAVSLLVPGRGMRQASLCEIDARQEAGPWAVAAQADTAFGPVDIGTGRMAEPGANRRIVRINGATAKTQTELAEYLALIWLTPAMDRLFADGATHRRRFLDRMVYSFDPAHGRRVNAYEKAMRERNKLLERPCDSGWLDACEYRMSTEGVAIAASRLDLLERLEHALAVAHSPFPRPAIALEGTVEASLQRYSAAEAEAQFQHTLRETRARDAAAGRTLTGIHRTDLLVHHTEKAMPAALCSTGEQKALLLSIVLAHARARHAWSGTAPLLLLDEVAAHLDPSRRAHLFEELLALNVQAWMTGTDAALFQALEGQGQFFAVANGCLFAHGLTA